MNRLVIRSIHFQDISGGVLKSTSGKWFVRLLFVVLFLPIATGCGNSGFGSVDGRVTLDGSPLENAFVEYAPASGQGSTSSGRTNASGDFSLSFSRDQSGALVGEHIVRITTRDIVADENGNDRWLPEKLGKRYNVESELKRDVKAGANQHDFELESDK
jgi:hypothetical protein